MMKISKGLVILALTATLQVDLVQANPPDDLTLQARSGFMARTNNTSIQVYSREKEDITRNPQFWLNGKKGLTAVCAGYGPGANLITPWHVVGANHWKNAPGNKLLFCDLQNHLITRTVIDGMEIKPESRSDIWLAVLDQALPSRITPLPIMPMDWTNHIVLSRFPVAAMNKESEFGSAEILSFRQPVKGWFLFGYLYHGSSLAPAFQFEPRKAGDSGRPIVTLVGEELVLLGHITLESDSGTFAGPDYSLYASDLQAGIGALGTNALAKTQKLNIIDLSLFR